MKSLICTWIWSTLKTLFTVYWKVQVVKVICSVKNTVGSKMNSLAKATHFTIKIGVAHCVNTIKMEWGEPTLVYTLKYNLSILNPLKLTDCLLLSVVPKSTSVLTLPDYKQSTTCLICTSSLPGSESKSLFLFYYFDCITVVIVYINRRWNGMAKYYQCGLKWERRSEFQEMVSQSLSLLTTERSRAEETVQGRKGGWTVISLYSTRLSNPYLVIWTVICGFWYINKV